MSADSYPPIPPETPKKNNATKKILIGCGGLFAVAMLCLCVFAGFGFYLQYAEEQAYKEARAAFDQADCSTAVPKYEKLIGDATDLTSERMVSAQQELKECQAFLAAKNQELGGDGGKALVSYASFLAAYPASLLAGAARDSAAAVYQNSGAQKLADSTGFCDALNHVLGSSLLPDRSANLKELYPACAMFYERRNQFEKAVSSYEAFLAEYPGDPGEEVIKALLAKAIVQAARASGAGEIPEPQVSGTTGTGQTMVIIQNDSPDRLRIIFSGSTARIEELEPCTACQEFSGAEPEVCPELGPVGRYELPPGAYDVVVESGSGSEVTPWTGTWTLAEGDEYSSCFYIVKTSMP